MTTSSSPESSKPAGVFETVKQGKEMAETVVWVITTGIAVVGFLQTPGSLTKFLLESGMYGVACYVAACVILPVVILIFERLDRMFGRVTTDTAQAIITGVAVLGGGLLVRSIFAPGVTEDLDTIGTAFGVLLGIGTLSIPVLIWWYTRGSQPRSS